MSDDPLNDLAMANQTPRVVRPRRIASPPPLSSQPVVLQIAQPAKPFHTGFMVTLGVLAALFMVWLGIVIYTAIGAQVALEIGRSKAAAAESRAAEARRARAEALQADLQRSTKQAAYEEALARQAAAEAMARKLANDAQDKRRLDDAATNGRLTGLKPTTRGVKAGPLSAAALKIEGTYLREGKAYMRITNLSGRLIKEAALDIQPYFTSPSSSTETFTDLGGGKSMEIALPDEFKGIQNVHRLTTVTRIVAAD